MAENRLFQMVYLLLEKGSITAPQLANYFEVSVRTIYRDIDILSAAGIPVYTTPGKGGGISLQESFVLITVISADTPSSCLAMMMNKNAFM